MRCFSFFVCLLLCTAYYGYGQPDQPSQTLLLPKLLVSEAGDPIDDSVAWLKQRRPEILRLFKNHVYGEVPHDFDSIRFETLRIDSAAMEGQAIRKEVAIHVTRQGQSLTINLLLFTPALPIQPIPAFLLINHRAKENTDPTRAIKEDFWPAEEVIARGYAIAAFQVSDVAADNNSHYREAVLRLYPEQLEQRNGMKAIGAWGWGASRVLDYLSTDTAIDHTKVAIVGHSRGGKAALWCAAQDDRFALAISNNSGCTGAALARRMTGEQVTDINVRFPYWFCDRYQAYNNLEAALPVDQHMLIALIAPRAVYVASAAEDDWADPLGEFLAIKHAEPVFSLFGILPLPAAEQPVVDTPVHSTHLGYHLRAGKHDLTLYDWERYLDFADQHFNFAK